MIATPLVTIVIPVYNRLCFLDRTLKSVFEQSFSDWQLIVVDDGSSEDVEGFIRQFPDPRITFVKQTNQGNAAARNAGIRLATGRYIICLDSDDVWASEMLSTCVTELESRPEVDVVYVQSRCIDKADKLLPMPAGPEPRNGDLLEPLLMGFPILPSSAVARRSCFEQWGAHKPGLDDWELWLRWAVHGCHFTCIPEVLLYYRVHDLNLNWDWPRRRKAHFEMLDCFYSQAGLPPEAIRLRSQAYANQHYEFTLRAWRLGRADDGLAEFSQLAKTEPERLRDLGFYTTLACSYQDQLDHGTARNLNLERSHNLLKSCLDGLFVQQSLPDSITGQRSQAYAWAYIALARLAYSVPHDMAHARRFLMRGLAHWPAVFLHTDWLAWLIRSLIGFDRLTWIKALARSGAASFMHPFRRSKTV